MYARKKRAFTRTRQWLRINSITVWKTLCYRRSFWYKDFLIWKFSQNIYIGIYIHMYIRVRYLTLQLSLWYNCVMLKEGIRVCWLWMISLICERHDSISEIDCLFALIEWLYREISLLKPKIRPFQTNIIIQTRGRFKINLNKYAKFSNLYFIYYNIFINYNIFFILYVAFIFYCVFCGKMLPNGTEKWMLAKNAFCEYCSGRISQLFINARQNQKF